MANYQEDIYTAFRNALDTIGAPQVFYGYPIRYYDKTYQEDVKDLLLGLLDTSELIDTNQAEIVLEDGYPIVDKIAQMRYLISLIPQDVQLGLGVNYD